VRAFVILLVLTVPAIAADQPNLPFGYTCEQVRAAVAKYGRIGALALAKINGATGEQIAQAKKCLK
jgi:hypothetical protein